jgi:signal transduction histidine kinase
MLRDWTFANASTYPRYPDTLPYQNGQRAKVFGNQSPIIVPTLVGCLVICCSARIRCMGARYRFGPLARLRRLLDRLSLSQQYLLASLLVLIGGAIGVGLWVGQQIETGIISQTAGTTALYVDSFVTPHLQDYGRTGSLSSEEMQALGQLVENTPLGQRIVTFKVWDPQGRILYSTDPSIMGREFPLTEELARALKGQVASDTTDLEKEENVSERGRFRELLQTYSPVWLDGSNRVIAVAEFYQTTDALHAETRAAQIRSWLVVAVAMLAIYLLLAGIVRRGSTTIARQQAELREKVTQLTEILAQNEKLGTRVRTASARTAALNERFLRRISAELHDGPAQDLAFALLRLDSIAGRYGGFGAADEAAGPTTEEIGKIEGSLARALRELRAVTAGLRLPELEGLTLAETVSRVVRAHERRTDSLVALQMDGLPEHVPLSVKIIAYRVIQEALSNAYRHGQAADQGVSVRGEGNRLSIQVSDRGPGFIWPEDGEGESHLGLLGMRERVESLGGHFEVESRAGEGTRVITSLSLNPAGP